ncbi:Uncharacterised protein [uncultured archaeon]|nr:Uncharacterised protein [uncultured archaeon]
MKEVWKKRGVFNCKRSQVTIFVILGILIVAGLATFLTFRSTNNKVIISGTNIDPDIKPINNFVTECVRTVGNDAIYQIGKTGGFVVPPEPKMNFDEISDEGLAFYLYDKGYRINDSSSSIVPSLPGPATPTEELIEKENLMPSKENMEDELSKYMDSFIYFCINDFKNFPDFNVTSGEARTTAVIENGKVSFLVNYPLQISKGEKTYSIRDFEAVIPVRLNEIHSLITELMTKQMEKQDAICMSCLTNLSNKYDMKIKMTNSKEGIVFGILDEKSKIKNADYLFYFANKYD